MLYILLEMLNTKLLKVSILNVKVHVLNNLIGLFKPI